MRRIVLLGVVALFVCVAFVPAASARGGCVNLHASTAVKGQLLRTFRAAHGGHGAGPRSGSLYYGRCGSTHYAIGDFKVGRSGYQDQPEAFMRRSGHSWHDRGDTGGPRCEANVPGAMKRAWHISCS